jgi:hypothetical protein
MNSPASGWQRDPTARHEYRYWDGSRWTDDVSDRGVTSTDPMAPSGPGADPTQVIDPTQAFPSTPSAPTQTHGAPGGPNGYGPPPASGYPQDGAPGFGPYGTLPNQPGSYGSYGSGGVPPVPGPQPGSGAKTGLFVGIGVLVLAVIGVAAFLLTKDDGDEDETSTNPLSEQTDPGGGDPTLPPSDSGDDSGDSTDGSGDSGDSGEVDSLDDLADVDPGDIDEDTLIPLVVDELTSTGTMTEEQATCMAEAMFDQFTVEEIIELGESGGNPLDGMTSEQMSDLTNAVVDCMSV